MTILDLVSFLAVPRDQAVILLSYFVVFLMYNCFVATEFSWDDVKVDKHREGSEGSEGNTVNLL
ncbi:hypothetical protein KY289_020520 [Solanum tuberosum]|nr:hypothetical protein KY289_020520 [Solanum tuberosum]